MYKPFLLRTLFLLIVILTYCLPGSAQSILTNVAGNGINVESGDGGPTISAGVADPYGSGFDNAGNFYFSTNNGAKIRKISIAGIITTVAGNGVTGYSGDGGAATNAQLCAVDVAIDAGGNMYISDQCNNVVRKVNTSGIITTVIGTGVSGYTGDGSPASAARIDQPGDIVIDGSGNIYIATMAAVRKVNTSGIITTVVGTGVGGFSGDGGPATAAQIAMSYPSVVVDAPGNIYFIDGGNYRIRKVDVAGIINTIAGNGTIGFSGDGGPATSSQFELAMGIALGSTGDIYFSDGNNNRIRKVNTSGTISTVAGNGSTSCTGFGGPPLSAGFMASEISFDQAQNMYFSDMSCSYIQKISSPANIVTGNFSAFIERECGGVRVCVASASSASLSVHIYYGDNSNTIAPLTGTAIGYKAANLVHSYSSPGTYSIRMVLLNGATPIDSATYSYDCLLCNSARVDFYLDGNVNCIKDAAERLNNYPVTVEVDSNGVVVDTISTTSGIIYTMFGIAGDVYSFKVFEVPAGMFVSCPAGGIITDTLKAIPDNSSGKYIALSCLSGSGFDLAEFVHTLCGRHTFKADILINNTNCAVQPATYTTQISPKYVFQNAVPPPSSVVGNTVTWSNADVSGLMPQWHIEYTAEVPGAWLFPGDTAHSNHEVTPVAGDANNVNNTLHKIDTVRSSFDPNEIVVTPEGYISSGTQLQYTIHFENDGNDTAQNIYVMDTLSEYLIPSSMRVLASSAVMNTIPIRAGGKNIVKFDFPGIKLLDSSHHNLCTGMLVYTIKTRTGLPDGTLIPNNAGIFFDDNPVVPTNIVVNTIGIPSGITGVNSAKTEIYPNPATDELTIKMELSAYSSFVITNSIGQQLMQQPLSGTQTKVDIKLLPAGIYYISLRGEHGSKIQKFVKM